MPSVGSDLQDHLQVRMQFRCTAPITANDVINNWRHRYGAGIRYMLSGKGLLTSAPVMPGRLPQPARSATPDVQIHFLIFSTESAGAAGASVPRLHGLDLPIAAGEPWLCPHQNPITRRRAGDPAALSVGRTDCDTVIAGLHVLRRVMGQPVMRKLIAEERAPGPQCESDADLLGLRRNTGTRSIIRPRPAAWDRMRRVVDERLRVRSFEHLRGGRRLDHADRGFRQHQWAAVMIGEKAPT